MEVGARAVVMEVAAMAAAVMAAAWAAARAARSAAAAALRKRHAQPLRPSGACLVCVCARVHMRFDRGAYAHRAGKSTCGGSRCRP